MHSTAILNVSFVGKGIQIINVYLILSSLPSYDFACMLSHMWQPNTCIMPMSIMVYLRIHRRVLSAFALSKTLCFSFFQELTPETFVWIEPETSILQCKSCKEAASPKLRLKTYSYRSYFKGNQIKMSESKGLLFLRYGADVTFLTDTAESVLQLI